MFIALLLFQIVCIALLCENVLLFNLKAWSSAGSAASGNPDKAISLQTDSNISGLDAILHFLL